MEHQKVLKEVMEGKRKLVLDRGRGSYSKAFIEREIDLSLERLKFAFKVSGRKKLQMDYKAEGITILVTKTEAK